MRLANRRIVITGGGSGIGLATAKLFQSEGAAVAVLDRSPKSLDTARANLPGAAVIECDVAVESAVERAVSAAALGLGGIDGLCNVAGIGTRKSFEETTAQDMMTDIAVNLIGPFLVSKAVLPHLRTAGGGTIVNVASGLALRPTEGRTAYGASKGGLITMTKAMAIDLAQYKVRVNVVCPGLIDTPIVQDTSHGPTFTPEQFQKLMDRRILRRMGEARELADAMLFLTSNESSFITATTLAVDGGGSMH
jgi:NAD(P)-dependent dehydrogenase (short-subunit alcohol dehydrogenase family)